MSTKTNIPLGVPKEKEKEYLKNYNLATRNTGNLFMFACDQKVEHLNDDFTGHGVSAEMSDPEHFFKIAAKARIGVMATQLGMLSLYARDYPQISYLVKVNSKTNILTTKHKDPLSDIWIHLDEIIKFKKQSKLNIVGVGYTIYLGSWYESEMFNQAAHLIYQAHQAGLITVLWMYPRGKAVKDETDIHLIAGGAGVACCLGSDFVKVNYPYGKNSLATAKKFKEVVNAAGRSKVICVGGPKSEPKKFLKEVYLQKTVAGTCGSAIGRNIYQNSFEDAVKIANHVADIIFNDKKSKDL